MKTKVWINFGYINIALYGVGMIFYIITAIFGNHELSYLLGSIIMAILALVIIILNILAIKSIKKRLKSNLEPLLISKIFIGVITCGIILISLLNPNSFGAANDLLKKEDNSK